MDAKDVDWTAVKGEYLTTGISLERIAEKYGIAPSTIKRKSVREGWVEEKKQRKTQVMDQVIRNVIESDTKRACGRLEGLQETAEGLGKLVKEELAAAWKRREEREHSGGQVEEADIKILKDLTATLKGVADVMREVYAIPTIREKIEMEKWEREKAQQTGGDSGGVIVLAEIAEEANGTEDYLETAAETD